MTKQHIDRLKELVLTSADLTEPIDYFIQHVSTDAEIARASQPAGIAAAPPGQARAGGTTLRTSAVRPHAFVPARSCLSALARRLPPGRLRGASRYFDDVKTGILFIAQLQDIMNAKYVRFSLVPQSERTARS